MNGVSTEYIEAREDEIARMLTAGDDVDELRHVLRLMRKRGLITPALYDECKERLDRIAGALLQGKHNTATLRNGGGR